MSDAKSSRTKRPRTKAKKPPVSEVPPESGQLAQEAVPLDDPEARVALDKLLRSNIEERLGDILGDLADALSFQSVACKALEALEEDAACSEVSPVLVVLRHGLQSLWQVHTRIDNTVIAFTNYAESGGN